MGAPRPMGLYGPIATLWNGSADQLKFLADQLKLHGCVHFTKETCLCGFKMSKNGPSDQSEMTQDQLWPQSSHVCCNRQGKEGTTRTRTRTLPNLEVLVPEIEEGAVNRHPLQALFLSPQGGAGPLPAPAPSSYRLRAT